MKKVLFLFSLIFFCSSVFAISGVSPGSYNVNFKPRLNRTFTFTFTFDNNTEAQIYAEGDLSKYVSFDKDKISGEESVNVFLNLPLSLNTSGVNKIIIGARQIASSSSGVGLAADVRGVINVNVPHSGKWVDLALKVPDMNVGDVEDINLKISNNGKEDVEASPMIQVFKGEIEIKTIHLAVQKILSSESVNIVSEFDSSNYSGGKYLAVALADYGSERIARNDASFKLGNLSVNLLNYTKELDGAGIEKFDLDVQSLYNDEMPFFVEVVFNDLKNVSFKTPPVQLKAWETKKIETFFDSSKLKKGENNAEVFLHCGDKVFSKNIKINVKDNKNLFLIFISLFFVIFLFFLVVLFLRKKK